ncbi:MAG: ATP-binding cassette domain-containing protein, partial [Actinomycetes bacterium]
MINYDFDPTDPPWGSAKRARQFCWTALDRRTRIRLVFVTAVSASLAILDFIAVLMMAALGASVALLVTGVSPSETSLPIPDLHLPPERLIVVLGVGATLLLAAKNLLSWWASRRVYLFMSNRVPQFSTDIYRRYMTSSFPASQAISVQAVVSAVSVTSAAMAMVLTGFTGLVTEAVLLTLLVALLLVASPLLFVVSVLYFGGISWVIFRVVGKRSADNGRILSERGLMAVQTLTESVGFAPEIRLYGLTEGFVSRLQRDQMRVARTNAFQQSWTQTPRYVLETALLLGFAAFASISFITRTPQEAAFAVGLFLVTTARIVPSLLRISGNWSNIRLATAQIWMLRPVMELPMSDPGVAPVLTDAVSRDRTADAIRLSGVGFKYPGSDDWALRDVSLEVRRGTRVALVGSTGAGKSTLAELFLGLIHPTTGTMQTCFDSIGPDALVALVPQDVYIAPDSIRNNVALSVVGEPA